MAPGCLLKSTLVAWQSLATCGCFGTVFRSLQRPTSSTSPSGPRSTLNPSTTITGPLAPEERERFKVIQRQKAKIVDILNHLGATVEDETGSMLSVSASLRVEDVYKLAKFDDVGLVSYEDRSVVLDVEE